MAQMHKELYGHHEEFSEVNMRFKELEDIGLDEYDRAVAEAAAEGKKKGFIETAKNMLKERFDLAVIARITKLPEEEILALR
jgi:predicted transposase/invertase (TIGR01784 family)